MNQKTLFVLILTAVVIYAAEDEPIECNSAECIELGCRSNEIPSNCSSPCPPTCRDPSKICIYPCLRGCVCRPGYIRESYPGNCVKESSCPKECRENEVWESCSDAPCKLTCRNFTSPTPCTQPCIPGCSCRQGFVWNEEQTHCVSTATCCASNQIWEKCSDNACKRTCENKNIPIACPKICIPGCSCQIGNVWNKELTECIQISSCPKVCGPHQVWESCSDNACKRTCENKDLQIGCPAICVAGCSCQPGYVWTADLNECISVESCTKSCGTHQIWEECSDNACKRTCQNKDDAVVCPTVCLPGCSCRSGYVWNAELTECVPKEKCPKKCGPNQIWELCSDNMCRKTCEFINGPIGCPRVCIPGCSCRNGFVWNEDLTNCIPIQNCKLECGSNQHWTECSDVLCKRTCANMNDNSIVCPKACISGCTCNPGYVWNSQGTQCILACDCEKVCGINEVWEKCSDINCKTTCKDLHHSIPVICDRSCVPGCSCLPNFVWDEQRKMCISVSSCPHHCEENAEWSECTSACERTCQGVPNVVCLPVCIPGCKCKNGYLYDRHQLKCVSISNCTRHCEENKEWCRFTSAYQVTCQNFLKPRCHHAEVSHEQHYPGCVCEAGTILDEESNECVTPLDCIRLIEN